MNETMVHDETIVESESVALAHNPASRAVAMSGSAGSVQEMINYAIERNVPVESLEKLFGLYERMSARDAAREFNEALAAFQRECPPIKKAKTADVATRGGSGFAYTYADLPEIKRTIDPILAKYGLAYSWDSQSDGKLITVICTLRHVNGHSVTSSMGLPVDSAAAMSPQQKYGAAMTFGQRRTLANVTGITIEDEHPETAKAVDPTPISDDQAMYLNDLLTELGGTARSRFLRHYEIAKVSDLRATEYDDAVAMLSEVKSKRAEKQL